MYNVEDLLLYNTIRTCHYFRWIFIFFPQIFGQLIREISIVDHYNVIIYIYIAALTLCLFLEDFYSSKHFF